MSLYIYDSSEIYVLDFMICFMILPTPQALCCPVVVSLVNYELEVVLKGTFKVSWRLLYQNMSVVSYENHVRPVGSWWPVQDLNWASPECKTKVLVL